MRTKLSDRKLPNYTKGEEIFNMTSHIVGGAIGIVALLMCTIKAALGHDIYGVVGSIIYGASMILLYTFSSIYHGLKNGTAKKVFQVLDHCTIYILIAGSYTPILLSAIRLVNPVIAWSIFILEWGLTIFAASLTAIDLKKYAIFSMTAYIIMGWAIIPVYKTVIEAIGVAGFSLLLIGGILYTIGAVLYGIGKKKKYMHNVFHVFVLLGSFVQFLSIFMYAL